MDPEKPVGDPCYEQVAHEQLKKKKKKKNVMTNDITPDYLQVTLLNTLIIVIIQQLSFCIENAFSDNYFTV